MDFKTNNNKKNKNKMNQSRSKSAVQADTFEKNDKVSEMIDLIANLDISQKSSKVFTKSISKRSRLDFEESNQELV